MSNKGRRAFLFTRAVVCAERPQKGLRALHCCAEMPGLAHNINDCMRFDEIFHITKRLLD